MGYNLRFTVHIFNSVDDFVLFNFLKHVLTLTFYISLDVQILNPDILFKIIEMTILPLC